MNNRNVIKLINENGVAQEYGEIPDLWHIAEGIRTQLGGKAADEILQVWQMAHDLKSLVEGQGEAKLIEPKTMIGPLPKDLGFALELARHRADMWSDYAEHGMANLDCFDECDADELGEMSDITNDAVANIENWYWELKS